MVETGRDADSSEGRLAISEGNHPGAQPEEDDADVLDAVIGEEPFEIVLHQRIQHTEDGG